MKELTLKEIQQQSLEILQVVHDFCIANGITYSLAYGTLIGAIREILGSGSIFGIGIFGDSFEPMLILVLASGGFLSYGILLGIINAITNHNRKAKLEKGEN